MNEPLDETDEDLRHADTPPVAKAAAALAAMSGLFVLLSGVQVLDLRFRMEWLELVPYLMIVAGVGQIVVGAMLGRARAWAVYTAAGGGALISLGMVGWFLFFLLGVGLSCIVFVAPVVSLLATVLAVVSIPGVRRTSAARTRLAERGLGLGL